MDDYNNEYARIGLNVRFLRVKQDVSQTKLAELTGLTVRTISLLERGEIDPRLSTLMRISKALDMTVSELLEFEVK